MKMTTTKNPKYEWQNANVFDKHTTYRNIGTQSNHVHKVIMFCQLDITKSGLTVQTIVIHTYRISAVLKVETDITVSLTR